MTLLIRGIVHRVGRKRKAWWIVGGVLCFFVLIFAAILIAQFNSIEARLDRTLVGVLEEYGFELVYPEKNMLRDARNAYVTAYRAPVLTDDEIDDVTARIYEEFGPDDMSTHSFLNADGSKENNIYISERGVSVMSILIARNELVYLMASDTVPSSAILIFKRKPIGVIERLKNLWPW